MTKQDKLTKLIEIAVENGWDGLEMWSKTYKVSCDDHDGLENRVWIEYEEGDGEQIVLACLLFSHDFAKAIWGEEENVKYILNVPKRTKVYVWQYHLQQAVISEDPLEYYWENK